jgi:hypothetical protein
MLLWMIIIFDLSGQKTKEGRSMPFWTQRGFDHPRNPVSFCGSAFVALGSAFILGLGVINP